MVLPLAITASLVCLTASAELEVCLASLLHSCWVSQACLVLVRDSRDRIPCSKGPDRVLRAVAWVPTAILMPTVRLSSLVLSLARGRVLDRCPEGRRQVLVELPGHLSSSLDRCSKLTPFTMSLKSAIASPLSLTLTGIYVCCFLTAFVADPSNFLLFSTPYFSDHS